MRVFGYNQELAKEAVERGEIDRYPGKQNRHHGRKPRTYKHKRDMIRASKRRNRGR